MIHNQIIRLLADHFHGIIFTSLIIDAHEGRYVVIVDVPEAYLNADTPEDKFILLNIEV